MSNQESEWNVANGERVRARVDLPKKVESVWVGARLASRSPPGGKPDKVGKLMFEVAVDP